MNFIQKVTILFAGITALHTAPEARAQRAEQMGDLQTMLQKQAFNLLTRPVSYKPLAVPKKTTTKDLSDKDIYQPIFPDYNDADFTNHVAPSEMMRLLDVDKIVSDAADKPYVEYNSGKSGAMLIETAELASLAKTYHQAWMARGKSDGKNKLYLDLNSTENASYLTKEPKENYKLPLKEEAATISTGMLQVSDLAMAEDVLVHEVFHYKNHLTKQDFKQGSNRFHAFARNRYMEFRADSAAVAVRFKLGTAPENGEDLPLIRSLAIDHQETEKRHKEALARLTAQERRMLGTDKDEADVEKAGQASLKQREFEAREDEYHFSNARRIHDALVVFALQREELENGLNTEKAQALRELLPKPPQFTLSR